ncbi:MAG TPA: magnesium transporter, partial [bacterium]|nr:magnesium transporter [bacterium]
LLGWCTWQQLVLAEPQTRLEELIPARCPSVDALTPQEEVARLVAKYDIAAIPVVDIDGRLLGTITNDDVIDVIAEEASEDMMLVAGGSELELHQPSVVKSMGSRMPWLVITFAAGCANALLMGQLETITIATNFLAIMFYVPLTMGMGGNVGLQTSTMTIRRLILGETDLSTLALDLWRELRVGLLMGVTFGIALGSVAAYILPSGNQMLGVVVGLALFLAVTASALMGAIVPIAFHKLAVDPAVASSPLVTAVNDLISLTIYVSIALLILNH